MPLVATQAREGRIDLTIGGMPPHEGPYEDATLFDDDFAIVARAGHPAFARKIGLEAFGALPQGRTLSGSIDTALAKHGMKRFIALSLTHFSAWPDVLVQSDLVACVPRALNALPGFRVRVVAHSLPFPSPRYALRTIWHRRHAADPGHLWLRHLVAKSAPNPGTNF